MRIAMGLKKDFGEKSNIVALGAEKLIGMLVTLISDMVVLCYE